MTVTAVAMYLAVCIAIGLVEIGISSMCVMAEMTDRLVIVLAIDRCRCPREVERHDQQQREYE